MKIKQSYIFAVGIYFIFLLIHNLETNHPQIAIIQSILGILVTSLAFGSNKMKRFKFKKIGNKMISLSLFSILSFQDECVTSKMLSLQFILLGMLYQKIITIKIQESKSKLKQRTLMSFYCFLIFNVSQFYDIDDQQNIKIISNQLIFLLFTIGLYSNYYFFEQDRQKQQQIKLNEQNNNGNQSIQKVVDIFSLQSPSPDFDRDLILNQDYVKEQESYQDKKDEIDIVEIDVPHKFIRINRKQRSASSQQQQQKKSKTEYVSGSSSKHFISSDNNYFKELFNQLPNGIMVLGENERLSYINYSFCEIMGSQTKIECKSIFLRLQNCQKEFQEEENFQKIFKAFDQRLRNFKVQKSSSIDNDFDEISELEDGENESQNNMQSNDEIDLSLNINIEKYLSQSQNVREEYIKNIQNLNKYIQKHIQKQDEGQLSNNQIEINNSNTNNTKKVYGKIKFFNETKMFCRFGQQEQENESQENFQQEDIFRQQSSKSQNNFCYQKIFEVTFIPFVHGSKAFILILISDVTMFNQLTVLQQINKNKTNMLYQVSHELRTPLNSILLLSEKLMEKYNNNQDIEDFYEPIYTATSQLINLINDQLDIAQLNAGKFKIVYQEFDLKEFLDKIFKIMKPQSVMRKLYLKLVQGENIPYTLVSDPNRIRQILLNLMSNSLKFTQVGGITVSITKAGQFLQSQKQNRDNYYKFSVQDTGLGIEISNQQTLFKAFGKLNDTQNMNSQGVGLGLMISHTIAQQISKYQGIGQKKYDFDGKGLTVKSEGIGKGSEFNFYVYDNFENQRQQSHISNKQRRQSSSRCKSNFREQKNKIIQIEEVPKNLGESYDSSPQDLIGDDFHQSKYNFKSCSCKEILIIDDEPFNIRSLCILLKDYNLKIQQAINFNEVSNFLNELIVKKDCCNWIRVILMDLEMPQKNGFQMTQYIRKIEQDLKQNNKQFRSSIIIACSGHKNDQIKDQCLEQGMDYYIEKPVNKKLLLSIISNQISEVSLV